MDFSLTLLWHGHNIYPNPKLTVISNPTITCRKPNPGSDKYANEGPCTPWARVNMKVSCFLRMTDIVSHGTATVRLYSLGYFSLHSLTAIWSCFSIFDYPFVLFLCPSSPHTDEWFVSINWAENITEVTVVTWPLPAVSFAKMREQGHTLHFSHSFLPIPRCSGNTKSERFQVEIFC